MCNCEDRPCCGCDYSDSGAILTVGQEDGWLYKWGECIGYECPVCGEFDSDGPSCDCLD